MVRSGAAIVRSINVRTDATGSSVCRHVSLKVRWQRACLNGRAGIASLTARSTALPTVPRAVLAPPRRLRHRATKVTDSLHASLGGYGGASDSGRGSAGPATHIPEI